MPIPIGTLINYLEQLAPRRLAMEWDNPGIQLGSLDGTARNVLVALDLNEPVLEKARKSGADFIVTHHPLIFEPLKSLRTDQPRGRLLAALLAAGITVYSLHTNLDAAQGGVSDALAKRLGLTDIQVLQETGREKMEKIVVFIPAGHENQVLLAMTAAGAGWIGNYSHCTFQVPGTGTFMPQEGTSPFIGETGKLERVQEIRLETIVPAALRNRVIQAMIKAHPYEEVAYDVYPLQNEGASHGFGRIGKLPAPVSLAEFASRVKDALSAAQLKIVGDRDKVIKKVAVCGGAGAALIKPSVFAGADVLVTGDLKYHEAQEAAALGLAVIDAGHDVTEQVVIPVLCDYLEKKIAEAGYEDVSVMPATTNSPWWFF